VLKIEQKKSIPKRERVREENDRHERLASGTIKKTDSNPGP
jgi:hypothetical protein